MYNANGHGTTPSSVTATTTQNAPRTLSYFTEETIEITLGSMSEAGYTFGGWNTLTTGNGTHYNANTEYNFKTSDGSYVYNEETGMFEFTTQLYGEWTTNNYTVSVGSTGSYYQVNQTYNSNNTYTKKGSIGTASVTPNGSVAFGTSVTFTASAIKGYTFRGWYTSDTTFNSSTFVSSENAYTTTVPVGGLSLHALYSINWYYADLNWKIDGTVYGGSIEAGYNAYAYYSVVKDGENLVQASYIDDSYVQVPYNSVMTITKLKLDGVEIEYSATQNVNSEYVSITPSLFTFTFTSNNNTLGSVDTEKLLVPQDTTYTSSENVFTLADGRKVTATTKSISGYTITFVGFSPANGTVSATTDVIANFIQAGLGYTVTYADKGNTNYSGNNVSSLVTSFTTEQLPVTLVAGTKANYTFGGWYASEDCSGTAVTQITTIGNKKFYAKWTYNLVYDVNKPSTSANISGTATNATVVSGDVITLPTLTLDGYIFNGWINGSNLYVGGTKVSDIVTTGASTIAVTNSQMKFVADWNLATREVGIQYAVKSYSLNGVSDGGYYGSQSTVSRSPFIKSSTDGVWQNTSATAYSNGTAFDSTKSYVLVTFDYASTPSITVNVGSEYQITKLVVGSTTISASSLTFANGVATYTMPSLTENTNVYAEFERKQVTVTVKLISDGRGVLSQMVTAGTYSAGILTVDGTTYETTTVDVTRYYGEEVVFGIMPNAGYTVSSINDLGYNVPNAMIMYSLDKIFTENGTIEITFTEQETWLDYASTSPLTANGGVITITTAEELARLAKDYLQGVTTTAKVVIANDIDLSAHMWYPIGTNAHYFNTTFDGDSFTISGLNVLNGPAIGLFGYNDGRIYNVKVSGTAQGAQYVGGVAGYNTGDIEYVGNSVNITGSSTVNSAENSVGGVAGYNSGKIYASYNSGAVTGNYNVGGIVGYNEGKVMNAYNTAVITNSRSVRSASIGGIVGYSTNANIGYVYNIGEVSAADMIVNKGLFIGQIASGTLTLPRWYLNGLTVYENANDDGKGQSQANLQPISTTAFNESSLFSGWNTQANNGYADDIWEINPENNGGYAYPVFVIKKNLEGKIVISGNFADAESTAVGFVTVTGNGKTWTFMLINGKTYTITKLSAGTFSISATSTINHTAVPSASSVTISETISTHTITISIEKVATGGFYGSNASTTSANAVENTSRQVEVLNSTETVKLEEEVQNKELPASKTDVSTSEVENNVSETLESTAHEDETENQQEVTESSKQSFDAETNNYSTIKNVVETYEDANIDKMARYKDAIKQQSVKKQHKVASTKYCGFAKKVKSTKYASLM